MAHLEPLMRRNFLEYASYVIVDRAIPDLRDGFKPVLRQSPAVETSVSVVRALPVSSARYYYMDSMRAVLMMLGVFLGLIVS